MTDLYLAASGWVPAVLDRAVPPACRRGISQTPSPEAVGDDVIIRLLEWRPRRRARRLVPAFSVLSDCEHSFRFEVSVLVAGAWSPWVAGASIGPARFPHGVARTEALVAEIDEFIASTPAESVRLVLRVSAADWRALFASPWFVSLSAWDGEAPGGPPAAGSAQLAVPPLSQMEADPSIRRRVCSPASLAMVLAFYGARVEVTDLAREILHPDLDLYGVWPAAIRAAARRGVAGYLLRFPDWASAAWCLEQGMPVIASVRYSAGELTGAAMAETSGHLVVLTGYAGDEVYVNDPAAPASAEVPRRYRLDEVRRVWLDRGGVGYVLFTPTAFSSRSRSPRR